MTSPYLTRFSFYLLVNGVRIFRIGFSWFFFRMFLYWRSSFAFLFAALCINWFIVSKIWPHYVFLSVWHNFVETWSKHESQLRQRKSLLETYSSYSFWFGSTSCYITSFVCSKIGGVRHHNCSTALRVHNINPCIASVLFSLPFEAGLREWVNANGVQCAKIVYRKANKRMLMDESSAPYHVVTLLGLARGFLFYCSTTNK